MEIKKDLPKYLRSSADPTKVSLSFKGAFVIAVLYIAHYFGFDVSDNDALMLVEGAITIIAGAMAVYGIIRKFWNVKQS